MPNSIDEYIQSLLQEVAACPLVRSSDILIDRRTLQSGLVRGELYFLDGSVLHFRELIDAQEFIQRLMYSFHYQSEDGELIFRYDDTPHHEVLPGFPYHKHVEIESNAVSAEAPDLKTVLHEIQDLYPLGQTSG